MTLLTSDTTIALSDAPRHVSGLVELMARHDVEVTRDGDTYRGRFSFGEARLTVSPDRVLMEIEAPDAAALNGIKLELSGSLSYVCGRELDIRWSGDVAGLTRLPKLCVLTVLGVETITPHMRRITFSGDNLARFANDTNLHMRLAFPADGTEDLPLPLVDGNGRIVWPEGATLPILRKYTVRKVDLAQSLCWIDFYLHADGGPGSRFAAAAKPGDVIGMIGPGGLGVRPADWYLLAGDETALPAIGRIVESLPASARGVALIEVADTGEEQSFTTDAAIEIRWLHRGDAAAGTTTLLADAVREVAFPEDGSTVFAWAAGEFDTFRSIRSHLRADRGLKTDQHFVLSYWRKGRTEEEMEKAGDH
ncbi:siderophore-interacting protein [Enterovirga rhinocerotis]|uniref:NADPH-dependent ferric siderophore reductase n=1 Tax=Enterovirga rhinocerotis TaxID=1339210 RepID=A0A4R7C6V5_9HYPH|nr:siderophore-interacting protein [Enterovirga rhinocerotis]TDR94128.1 NADPH-dependent ferric siderophore reductase [Enterovirga rhinocerotis]